MLKLISISVISFGLVAQSHAFPLKNMFHAKSNHTPVVKLKVGPGEFAPADMSGRWVGEFQGEQVELNIKQSAGSIEINGEYYEYNAFTSKGSSTFADASAEHSTFEPQEDGSIAFQAINVEKFYNEQGIKQESITGQLALQGDKLVMKMEMTGEPSVVIEFRKN